MTLRRRLALFLDPTLYPEPAAPPPPAVHVDLSAHNLYAIGGELAEMNRLLSRMERRKRRPRIIDCEHPELHPEVAA